MNRGRIDRTIAQRTKTRLWVEIQWVLFNSVIQQQDDLYTAVDPTFADTQV